MPKLSSLVRTKDIAIQWPDTEETLNITVVPDELTGNALIQMQERVKSADEDAEQLRFMCSFLATIIKWWDLTDDSGTAIEISEDSLFDNLPITVIGLLLQQIQKAVTVSP